MIINIDEKSGFCFGVVNTINKAEEELNKSGKLFCLGNIVHNNAEVERLQKKGLVTINYKEFEQLRNCKVLIRAHGEPPETYETARKNNIELIDASCKVVLKLQSRIRKSHLEADKNRQIVIYGKDGHAEVNGLVGQTNGKAIVVKQITDLHKINFLKPIVLFSQTTMDIDNFAVISDKIRSLMQEATGKVEIPFTINDTICRQVANRAPHLRQFAASNDIIIFASGKDSSNGKVLFEVCKNINIKSYFVTGIPDIDISWFGNANSVGICGATSTPRWLMEEIAAFIKSRQI